MGRYRESACRLCRRENQKLFLKGDRCFSEKCGFERRAYPPGQHGQGRVKFSEYSIQLREKQKVKRIYGLYESQFRKYFELASKGKGITGELLLQTCERRLDNVIFRMGFAVSRDDSRQLVRHGHVSVNGVKTDIPSFLVKKEDVVEVREKSRNSVRVQYAVEAAKRRQLPQWVEVDFGAYKGRVKDLPTREDISLPIEERLIVELYSK